MASKASASSSEAKRQGTLLADGLVCRGRFGRIRESLAGHRFQNRIDICRVARVPYYSPVQPVWKPALRPNTKDPQLRPIAAH